MSPYKYVERFFDVICISTGIITVLLSSFLGTWWLLAVGVGGMLMIISGSNFLNPHCRDKLLGRHGVES